MSLPTKAKVVIIGGGIHGLSTAWKLSEKYKNPNDIVVLEKKDTAAGASGIACGVVRNNYFQPAMRQLMAHSVEIWESDKENFRYNPVGYMQISLRSCIKMWQVFTNNKKILDMILYSLKEKKIVLNICKGFLRIGKQKI